LFVPREVVEKTPSPFEGRQNPPHAAIHVPLDLAARESHDRPAGPPQALVTEGVTSQVTMESSTVALDADLPLHGQHCQIQAVLTRRAVANETTSAIWERVSSA
jgi:hypothetical protein